MPTITTKAARKRAGSRTTKAKRTTAKTRALTRGAIIKGMLKRGDKPVDIAAFMGIRREIVLAIANGTSCRHVEAAPTVALPVRPPFMGTADMLETIDILGRAFNALKRYDLPTAHDAMQDVYRKLADNFDFS